MYPQDISVRNLPILPLKLAKQLTINCRLDIVTGQVLIHSAPVD
jgi:hypothetical protein